MQDFFETNRFSCDEVAVKTREIYQLILGESDRIAIANFDTIHTDDLQRIFDLYDRLFFDGRFRILLGNRPFRFRLSQRMTRTGAQTARFGIPAPGGQILGDRFEIAVSSRLLLDTFHDGQRSVVVCGLECKDRLSALQRLMEHEMVHLIELLVWNKSQCGTSRFGSLASRFFAHTAYRHQMFTRAEQLLQSCGIRQGDRVAFRRGDRKYVGQLNRVTRRATVLVEDPGGTRYSDGKRYAKFYVPVEGLEPISDGDVA